MSDSATDRLLADARNVGRWMAWDRNQTRLLAIGNTFEEAKQAAAATGEHSVTIAQLTARGPRRKLRWAHAMAVFVAMAPGLSFASSGNDGRCDPSTTASACEAEDEIIAPAGRAEGPSNREIA